MSYSETVTVDPTVLDIFVVIIARSETLSAAILIAWDKVIRIVKNNVSIRFFISFPFI